MQELRCKLTDITGKEYWARHPVSLSCVKSDDTPADSLKAVFFQTDLKNYAGIREQETFPEIKTVEVQTEMGIFFQGICDEQKWSIGPKGCAITICARSRGALLLDNEAMPQVYRQVTLSQLFHKHIAPYGFDDFIRLDSRLGNYVVGKGSSEWDVFSDFCRRVTGKLPYLVDNWVVIQPRGNTLHSITKERQVVQAVSYKIRRSTVLSQILVRDEKGRYSTSVNNPQAKNLGIKRKRYLIPPAQWARPTADAALRLEQSMERRNSWTVRLSGLLPWRLGDQVSLPELQQASARICEIAWEYGTNGATTQLILA